MSRLLLPNPEKAIVSFEKLEGYSLTPHHAEGQHKAMVFRSALGIGLEDVKILHAELTQVLLTQEAVPRDRNPYGQKYQIDFEMTQDDRQAIIRSVWMVRDDEDFPRFITCYIA